MNNIEIEQLKNKLTLQYKNDIESIERTFVLLKKVLNDEYNNQLNSLEKLGSFLKSDYLDHWGHSLVNDTLSNLVPVVDKKPNEITESPQPVKLPNEVVNEKNISKNENLQVVFRLAKQLGNGFTNQQMFDLLKHHGNNLELGKCRFYLDRLFKLNFLERLTNDTNITYFRVKGMFTIPFEEAIKKL